MSLTLEKFECEGDPTSLVARWERWKRALQIYLLAASIENSEKKKACLLHFGGQELQEIYFNIPDGTSSQDEAQDVFKVAIDKLDSYFAPKQSKVYERHVFRLMRQEPNEKFEKFLIRLRQQGNKCHFSSLEDNIIDQIVEKGNSDELRRKILQKGDEITLDKIIVEANALEAVNRQMEDFGNKSANLGINKVDVKQVNKKGMYKIQECTRCGNRFHTANDRNCPAKTKECFKCGGIGHYKNMCKSSRKRKIEEDLKTNNKKKFKPGKGAQRIDEVSEKETHEIDYVFNVNDDAVIDCKVGGIKVEMLIDSGCKDNLITEETWEILKKGKAQIRNPDKNPQKTFVAYGSKTPLVLKGSFNAVLAVGKEMQESVFYVIAGGTRNLLGRKTAVQLGVLKVGLQVNQIKAEEAFPKLKDVLIHIPIDESIQPVSQPYRRIPIPLEKKVQEKLEELIKRDIIEEVNGSSRWVSPIVPILKDNGEVRLCVDMRRANAAIRRENHPLPTMDKLLPQVRDGKYFSKLDIRDAFHQLELHPDSRHITTFITSQGMFRYKRLMFGITCAPEIFQKTVERILLGCDGVINFIDDILIYGRNKAEHNTRLERVIKVLRENNVVLRQDKCIVGVKKVQFLGHELSETGVKPLQKYISSIQDFRSPKTVAELQSFMGLVNYVGKWIPDLATITEPMKELLRNRPGKNSDIQKDWGIDQQKAFDKLKMALTNMPTLGYYDASKKTIVIADASPVGLGAVLVQVYNNEQRIIAFGSKTLTDCERRYCQTEKEALALVWAVEHFHMFLYGKEFDLVTDHKPLEVIFGPKSKPCARIERWVLRLQSYTFKVIYRPGKSNIADPLSILREGSIVGSPLEAKENYIQQIVEYLRPRAVSLKEIAEYSEKDTEMQKVKEGIYNNNWDEEVKLFQIFRNELCFYGGILLRGTKIVIPKGLRNVVLAAAHEGHPGIVAMKGRLRSKVWWPRYDREAENMVKSCTGCTLVSAPNPPHPLKRRELPDAPWKAVAMDLLGPLPSGEHILVIVDYFSRYKEIKICRKITTAEIIAHLTEICGRVGNPVSMTVDNGRQFVSEEFKVFCRERNIILHNTIPYWPQQNGEVERQNRDILKRLKIGKVEKKSLQECLSDYLTMYNSTPHSVTGKTPAELFYRRRFRDKIPMFSDVGQETTEDLDVRDRDKEMKEKGKEYADAKRNAKECDLVPGDKVYLKNVVKDNKLMTTFAPIPFTVEKANQGDIQVRNEETGQTFRRNVVHLKKVEGKWEVMGKGGENEEADSSDRATDNINLVLHN